jgi:hypothetical protein
MRCAWTLVVILLSCAGCADKASPAAVAAARPAAGAYRSVQIDGVKHIRQKPDFCGEAVTASWLDKLGEPYDQDDVFAISGMSPARGMGATTREMKTALERLGFDTGQGWYSVAADDADAQLENLFVEMLDDLNRGIPSIVCTHFDDSPNTSEHFRLVLGYDAERDEVIFHDPAVSDGAYKRMARPQLKRLWPLKYDESKWTVVRMRLEGKRDVPPPPKHEGFTPADYAQHVMKLRERLPRGFTLVLEPPFVVVGNEAPDVVRRRAAGTVRWSVDKLKRAFFRKDPNEIIDVWLFGDDKSYQHHAVAMWGEPPGTPYGYYSRENHAMVMNIATGGGTLVHEIVHPFIESNFAASPAWFNEGLGSLYEQSAERDGRIVGLTNWRLAGLQRAIRAGRVPSFRTLTATSTHQFYDKDPGTNYAQSRYLLYFMQEQGLLRSFYTAFTLNQKSDPTGYETLKQVLGEEDMADFMDRWQRWVLRLRFR